MTPADERELREALDDLWGNIEHAQMMQLSPETRAVAKDNHKFLHHTDEEKTP